MANHWISTPAPVARRVRAYFAPVDRSAQAPVLFDAGVQGDFNLETPPAPWISLGWIQGFTRKTTSKTSPILTGVPAAALEQVRETLQAEVSLQFLSWTKLTMGLATGSQHMNLLDLTSGAAVTPRSGSTATSIVLSSADASRFSPGTIIALDADYTGQTGYLGMPVAGAYLRQAITDVDYIRRITFNIAVVSEVNSLGLTLAEPLPGGAPAEGTRLQVVTGFVDREGGSFYQEWSALFLMEGSQGERIFFHYPRLQSMVGAEEEIISLDGNHKGGQSRVLLKGRFLALPIPDVMDGERVLCYRSFLPAYNALV